MKTDTKRKTQRPQACKMWANYHGKFIACHDTRSTARSAANLGPPEDRYAVPVAVIPLDDVGALVRCAYEASRIPGFDGFAQMTAALTAIGVLPRQRKGGSK